MTTHRLNLFPLNVVLFPGMGLPLHIFEERYKQMIREVLTPPEHEAREHAERRFGVCLIRNGPEVGEPAEPHLIGTEAEILSVRKLAEGRMNLMALGRRRFRVVEITQWRPWVAGEVVYLDEDTASDQQVVALGQRAREALVGYLQRALELAHEPFAEGMEQPNLPITLPKEPLEISYAAAAMLPIPSPLKQRMLEEPSTIRRLGEILEQLRRGQEEQEALLRLHQEHSVTRIHGPGDADNGFFTRN